MSKTKLSIIESPTALELFVDTDGSRTVFVCGNRVFNHKTEVELCADLLTSQEVVEWLVTQKINPVHAFGNWHGLLMKQQTKPDPYGVLPTLKRVVKDNMNSDRCPRCGNAKGNIHCGRHDQPEEGATRSKCWKCSVVWDWLPPPNPYTIHFEEVKE